MLSKLADFDLVVDSLIEYDYIFQRIMTTSIAVSSKSVPTLATSWSKDTREFTITVNPEFFNSLNFDTKRFVLMHEVLHIVYDFFGRVSANNYNPKKFNIAQDIVINHSILKMGFDRNRIVDWNKLCWIDTVKFNTDTPRFNASSDYYYGIIEGKEIEGGCGHCDGKHGDEPSIQDIADMFETIEDFQKAMSQFAGSEKYREIKKILQERTKAKNWENVSSLAKRFDDPAPEYNWYRDHYRLPVTDDTSLPNFSDVDKKIIPELFVFVDVSGSCEQYRDYFVRTLKSIPKTRFRVKQFTFNTEVAEIKDNNYQMGGGTSFTCINDFINGLKRHPDNIFVFSDGYGDAYNPKSPEKWNWFLFENNSSMEYIPKESRVFNIENLTPLRS